ncbi:hypothetical protein SKAU_G00256650 [Synaphobranchus kaupii]|uniref:Uncharacterized protein n=1 Tax=Synaphobranchus kaupii TaxID=118154 RepID=A0A9Q1F3X3_SYNKA|nr:hypothetical protein SKAU_G00256650 [Synaphobranchus kaupii]
MAGMLEHTLGNSAHGDRRLPVDSVRARLRRKGTVSAGLQLAVRPPLDRFDRRPGSGTSPPFMSLRSHLRYKMLFYRPSPEPIEPRPGGPPHAVRTGMFRIRFQAAGQSPTLGTSVPA